MDCVALPSLWWDDRTGKPNPGSADFRHKTTNKPLWVYGWCNSGWVQGELSERDLLPIEAANREFMAGNKKREVNGFYHNDQEQQQSDTVEALSLVALLKACAKQKNLKEGSKIHSKIVDKSFLTNIFVANTLVNMYAKCGALEKAQEVFEELPFQTVVSWNALITGYAQVGRGDEVLNCLEQMQLEGFSPNAITFACVLNACGSIGNVHKGQEVHADVVKHGLLEEGSILGTALVDMYANCGKLAEAQEVFNMLQVRDVICWTALIAGYAQHGDGSEALDCYERMQLEGCAPNTVTYSSILKACGSLGALEKGQEIHAKIIREGLLDEDIVVGNALVDMYAKCGILAKAQDVFNELQAPDLVSWTALIAGYVQYGFGEEALYCYERMQDKGFASPDAVLFSCVLKACSSIGFVYEAQVIYAMIVSDGLLEMNRVVCTALVDMYANCGMLAEAQEVFEKMPIRDVIVWTALMEGYAQLGKDGIVFRLFDKMIEEGYKPTFVTFTVMLNSCCHSGLLEKGEVYFEMIRTVYGIFPTLEHHTCLVDLFGRAGNLDKAVVVMEEMPFSVSLMMWHTLICACRQCGNVELGSWAFKHASKLNVEDASTYVTMRNMYAGLDMQGNADSFESLKGNTHVWSNNSGVNWWSDT